MTYISKKEQKSEVRKLLRRAKKAYEKAQQLESDFYALLYEYGIDLDVSAQHACNADNLNDAVSCYLQYSEGTETELIADIFTAQVNTSEGG